jgi:hypothetical protein
MALPARPCARRRRHSDFAGFRVLKGYVPIAHSAKSSKIEVTKELTAHVYGPQSRCSRPPGLHCGGGVQVAFRLPEETCSRPG